MISNAAISLASSGPSPDGVVSSAGTHTARLDIALVSGEIRLQMLEPFDDLRRVDARVGQAHEMLVLPGLRAAEMHTRAYRDTGRAKHRAAKVLHIGEALQPHRLGHIGKEVKGGIGLVTAYAGRLVQERDCRVAPLAQD